MATKKTVVPPFAWLGRYWVPVGLALVTVVAGFFRFYRLNELPPGLDETSARLGLQALNLSPVSWLPTLSADTGYSPVWVWLQAASIHVFGHNALALRLWPALLGTLAVVATWLWLRDWFGKRVAWSGAFTMAVAPWAVTISRSGLDPSLITLLVPLTLWLSSRAQHTPSTLRYALLGSVLALDLLSGPLGWLLALAVALVAAWRLALAHQLLHGSKQRMTGAIIFALGAASLGYFIGRSFTAIKDMPQTLGLITTPAMLLQNLVKVLLMFNVHGDENYRHNLAGEPLLNVFVGLMMVTGLLVSLSRLHRLRYRVLLLLTLVLLIPPVLTLTGSPNASWAAGVLPLVFALVGIGTGYMLELWYATFPINSAARATGQAAIILLLALSLLQGYTQYFRAWAGSTAVYSAFNEGSVQMADHLKSDSFTGERYAVLPAELFPVIQYLSYGSKGYRLLTPADLTALPVATANRQFYITAVSRDESVKVLKAKFPGGVLRPHYSSFNQLEIYYTYEVNK